MTTSAAFLNAETVTDLGANSYQVDLEVFSGPLDLLLFLIKKEEVEISNIPIARITRQYLKYIELMEKLDLEVAGEFVLMAATLIRIKTRLLLPVHEGEEDEGDPREELIWALMEYKKFREASEILKERALLEEQRYVPPLPVGTVEGRIDYLPATTLFDLVLAYRGLANGRKVETVHEVVPEEISIEERMVHVISCLREKDGILFDALYEDMPRKIVAVVSFIAMLELARVKRVNVQQAIPFSPIRLYRGELFDSSGGTKELQDAEQQYEEQTHNV